jgi:hypothetical protein
MHFRASLVQGRTCNFQNINSFGTFVATSCCLGGYISLKSHNVAMKQTSIMMASHAYSAAARQGQHVDFRSRLANMPRRGISSPFYKRIPNSVV